MIYGFNTPCWCFLNDVNTYVLLQLDSQIYNQSCTVQNVQVLYSHSEKKQMFTALSVLISDARLIIQMRGTTDTDTFNESLMC